MLTLKNFFSVQRNVTRKKEMIWEAAEVAERLSEQRTG